MLTDSDVTTLQAPLASDPTATRKQLFLASLSGVLLGLSQPLVVGFLGPHPVDSTGLSGLLAFVGMVPLYLAVRDLGPKRAYWLCAVAMVIKYSIVLYWLVIAMHVFGSIPIVFSIIALLLLVFVCSAGLSAIVAVSRLISLNFKFPYWIVFPVCWAGGEFLRNHGPMGGFPWGNDGSALATIPLLLQAASLVGVYGLVFWVILTNAVLAETYVKWRDGRRLVGVPQLVAVALMVLACLYGSVRLSADDTSKTIKVALLQGNIEQGIKNEDYLNRDKILKRYHDLQSQAVQEGAQLVVWPEAALPGGVRGRLKTMRNRGVVAKDKQGDPKHEPQAAIIGSVAVQRVANKDSKKPVYKTFNSAFALGPQLKIQGRMDKIHLVPFGEYVPWPLNIAVRQLVPTLAAFGEGTEPAVISIGGQQIPVGVTVCYEGLFPEITRQFVNSGAKVMFNITNDAWYGVSSAATQHLMAYAVRAVESGVAVARAANTGISAWVDSKGLIHDASSLYETTYVLADIPVEPKSTLYNSIGDIIPLACLVGALCAWFLALAGPGVLRRKRDVPEWVVGSVFCIFALATVISHFWLSPPGSDEAASTRNQMQFIGSALIGLGALSGRPWGATAQKWVGGLAFIGCFIGGVFASALAFIPAAIGGAVFLYARVRGPRYTREAQVYRGIERAHESVSVPEITDTDEIDEKKPEANENPPDSRGMMG